MEVDEQHLHDMGVMGEGDSHMFLDGPLGGAECDGD